MLVVAVLLAVIGAISGVLSAVFVREAGKSDHESHRFSVQTTWAGFFQGLCIGLIVSAALLEGLHYGHVS
jgi:drug/metabolite transporter (DMT)-like permease